MDAMVWIAAGIFAATIVVFIANLIGSAVAALLGVAVMIWVGVLTETEAFALVAWNVMAILVGISIIAAYFAKTGIPDWLAIQALRFSRGHAGMMVMLLSALAGMISLFVDNVVFILMMAPVALPLARALKLPLTLLILMIGFSSNFMGTTMLLGDLPPQMLDSVAGEEVVDFFMQFGRLSSSLILIISFAITLLSIYFYGFRSHGRQVIDAKIHGINSNIPSLLFASIVVIVFLLTVLGMSFRQALGVQLGFIAMTGAVVLVLVLELLRKRFKAPTFKETLSERDWRPVFEENYTLGASFLYWMTVPIVGVVEHDAYLLAFLKTIKGFEETLVPRCPLWWMLLWSGTLGSNLSVAGATALLLP